MHTWVSFLFAQSIKSKRQVRCTYWRNGSPPIGSDLPGVHGPTLPPLCLAMIEAGH